MRTTGIIIGAGALGSAVAFALAERGITDLHVVDADLQGALSSTERNAGGVRHLWQQRINVDLSRVTIAHFREHAQAVGFQQKGYLWLSNQEQAPQSKKAAARARERGSSYEELTPAEVQSRYPFLDKTEDLALGVFGADDGLVNANAVKLHYRKEAEARGVRFHDRKAVMQVHSEDPAAGKKVRLDIAPLSDEGAAHEFLHHPEKDLPGKETWTADFVVLCGGAWTAPLLKRMGVEPQIKPFRRQIAYFQTEVDLSPYGMFVDTSGVYFHSEGGNALAGLVLKNEPSAFRFEADPDFFESHLWMPLYERSSRFERIKCLTQWGGLYSYTPDTTGILGPLPGHKGVFEAHSFTGRGLMQSYGAGVAIAEYITRERYETIDASMLTRERFANPSEWLPEDLHI